MRMCYHCGFVMCFIMDMYGLCVILLQEFCHVYISAPTQSVCAVKVSASVLAAIPGQASASVCLE